MDVPASDCIIPHLRFHHRDRFFLFEVVLPVLLLFFPFLNALVPDDSSFMSQKLSGET